MDVALSVVAAVVVGGVSVAIVLAPWGMHVPGPVEASGAADVVVDAIPAASPVGDSAPSAPVARTRLRVAPTAPAPAAPDASERAPTPAPREQAGVREPDPLEPDASEAGDARLTLRLVDANTGEPVQTWVRLWRLAAPENDLWTAGDYLRASCKVPGEGLVLEDLPRAAYRVQCGDQRRGADDPPAFTVHATQADVTVRLAMPRVARATLTVLDENGDAVRRGVLRRAGGGSSSYSEGVPTWTERRRRKGANGGRRSLRAGVG